MPRSSSPRKQRKHLYQVSKPYARRFPSSCLSPELREKYGTRSISIRVGDTVRVLRGDYAGAEGKVTKVNRKDGWILIEGITREKVDGTTIPFPVHTSKVQVTRLDLDDKLRRESLEEGV
ncbi:MAG: 50S ribosomal protein L24 [Candidatus Bathyarchaeota archaeon]|nr:MAG: 50S ribosomal protein L24 [Candidatus Bathyarchaeota archaeon]